MEQQAKHTSKLAIASLACALISILFGFIPAIAAIITGIIALQRINKSQGLEGGKAVALAGQIIGYIILASSLGLGNIFSKFMNK